MPRHKLLFVDDDVSIRETLPLILATNGFEVTTVGTVPQALAKINQEQFEILLADLNIGEPGDGFTVVSAMRRLQPQARTYILTGYPDFATALEAIRRQVDDYLIKPTDVPTLLKTLASDAKRPSIQPNPGKRAATIIRENANTIVETWFEETRRDPHFTRLQVPKQEFIDHLPVMLCQIADRLENKMGGNKQREIESAWAHGRTRRLQGAPATLIVTESRILYRIIADCIQHHLLEIDFSTMIPDLILISDTLNEALSTSLRAFLSAEPIAA